MYPTDVFGILNVKATDGAVTGATAVQIGTSALAGMKRSGIKIAAINQDVYIKFLPSTNSSTPTITTTNYHDVVFTPGASEWIPVGDSVQVWVATPSGASTINYVEAYF